MVVDINPTSLDAARADGYLVVAGDATVDDGPAGGGDRAGARAHHHHRLRREQRLRDPVRPVLNPHLFVVARANQEGSEAKLGPGRREPGRLAVHPRRTADRRARRSAPASPTSSISRCRTASRPSRIEAVEVRPGGPLDGQGVGALRDDGIFSLAVVRGDRDYEPNPPPSASCEPANTSSSRARPRPCATFERASSSIRGVRAGVPSLVAPRACRSHPTLITVLRGTARPAASAVDDNDVSVIHA